MQPGPSRHAVVEPSQSRQSAAPAGGWETQLSWLLEGDDELPGEQELVHLLIATLCRPPPPPGRRRSMSVGEPVTDAEKSLHSRGALDPRVARKFVHPSGHVDLAGSSLAWSRQLRGSAVGRPLPSTETRDSLLRRGCTIATDVSGPAPWAAFSRGTLGRRASVGDAPSEAPALSSPIVATRRPSNSTALAAPQAGAGEAAKPVKRRVSLGGAVVSRRSADASPPPRAVVRGASSIIGAAAATPAVAQTGLAGRLRVENATSAAQLPPPPVAASATLSFAALPFDSDAQLHKSLGHRVPIDRPAIRITPHSLGNFPASAATLHDEAPALSSTEGMAASTSTDSCAPPTARSAPPPLPPAPPPPLLPPALSCAGTESETETAPPAEDATASPTLLEVLRAENARLAAALEASEAENRAATERMAAYTVSQNEAAAAVKEELQRRAVMRAARQEEIRVRVVALIAERDAALAALADAQARFAEEREEASRTAADTRLLLLRRLGRGLGDVSDPDVSEPPTARSATVVPRVPVPATPRPAELPDAEQQAPTSAAAGATPA